MDTNRRNFIRAGTMLGTGLAMGGTSILARGNKKIKTGKITDIFSVIKERRSVRKFKSTPVQEKHLEQC